MNMKKLLISTVAAALVASFAVLVMKPLATSKKVSADVQASCKACCKEVLRCPL